MSDLCWKRKESWHCAVSSRAISLLHCSCAFEDCKHRIQKAFAELAESSGFAKVQESLMHYTYYRAFNKTQEAALHIKMEV